MRKALLGGVGLALCAVAACGGSSEEGGATAANAAASAAAAEPDEHAGHGHDTRRPLPAFQGHSLDGEAISVSSLLGKRLLLFIFDPNAADAVPAAKAVATVAALRGSHNFQVLGVSTGANADAARGFAERHGLDFPILDDSSRRIAGRLGLRASVVLVGVDAEGYLLFGVGGAGSGDEAHSAIEAQLRERMRLPLAAAPLSTDLGERPKAPLFEAEHLNAAEGTYELADHIGEPVVLIFFLHTCPHCHEALRAIQTHLEGLPEDKRPHLVGVSVSNRASQVRAQMAREKLDFFPILLDPGSVIRDQYGVLAGVPDIFLIDSAGEIVSRTQGWREDRDSALMRMYLAQIAGAPVPMLLDPKGFSGNEVCAVCHQQEFTTWEFTKHAQAFDTLVKHGAEADAECVGCHVVGFEQTGGYRTAPPTPHFEDVGCESCHGRGGPHLSPGFTQEGGYEQVCQTCHNPTHSLGFEFASFLPKVSHAATRERLAGLSVEEKHALLAEVGERRKALLPSNADYVGSAACQSCHAAEYETWSASGHARAGETLREKDQAGNADCLACHTTAYDKPGGFPAGGSLDEHADAARVGCESCHGPGGDHVPEDAKKLGSILSLGDKCDSCVILQICGGCHDDANDPGFEFAVQEKIDKQRHGTIEAGTGKPKDPSEAALPSSVGFDIGSLERAFRSLDARG